MWLLAASELMARFRANKTDLSQPSKHTMLQKRRCNVTTLQRRCCDVMCLLGTSSFPTDHSNAVLLLQFFYVCASVVSYMAFVLSNLSLFVNPSPAEPGYALSLHAVQIQISWLLKKPTDLDLHCLQLSMWICNNNLDQVIWLAEN